MSADLVTVEPSTMMIQAVRAMSKARVGSVLVLEDGALVGIFTERDVLRAFDQMHADPARVSPMSKSMTWDPLTIGPDATVGEAMDTMLDGGFPASPGDGGRDARWHRLHARPRTEHLEGLRPRRSDPIVGGELRHGSSRPAEGELALHLVALLAHDRNLCRGSCCQQRFHAL
jgi:CBS domain-containing protein